KSPSALAAALYRAYEDDRYPHDRAFAMMAWAFAGFREDEVRAFAQRVLDEGRIEARIRPEMRRILGWAVARLGVMVKRALAMTPAIGPGGVLEPRLAAPPVYGEGKVRALEAAGIAGPLLGAFGDSYYDAAMLRAARLRVAVTPAAHLLEIAHTIPELVKLARPSAP